MDLKKAESEVQKITHRSGWKMWVGVGIVAVVAVLVVVSIVTS